MTGTAPRRGQAAPRWREGFPLARRARHRLYAAAFVVVIGLLIWSILAATPWPSALLIRAVFTQGGDATVREMRPYVPDTPLTEQGNVSYGHSGHDTTLDAYSPASADGPLPTVVWVHGGAWISGDKSNVDPYMRILASHGYTAIAVNYTIGPEATYPTAVTQINDALGYIEDHASELNVDADQIVLAGDSAGSQLASQLGVLTTNPVYSHLLGIRPHLEKNQLAGAILNCGVYDMTAMSRLTGILAWGLQTALWGYTGTKNWSETYVGSTMSTIDFVTGDFPPTFISGGNGDGLTWMQSVPMSSALKGAGVDVTELFWSANHEPRLPHEYQFHLLQFPEARTALDRTLDFLDAHTTGAGTG